jgi:DNA mismatch repair protein MutS2
VSAPRDISAPPAPRLDEVDADQGQLVPLAVGAELFVPSLGQPGTITRLSDDEAEVDVRGLRVRLRRSELEQARPLSSRERAESRRAADSGTRVVLQQRNEYVPLQLDLRGQRRDEAAEELDRYLNEAYLAGLKQVRVVHGKGTGAVRQAVHELLGVHPLVSRFAAAPREAGGDGATEIELVV